MGQSMTDRRVATIVQQDEINLNKSKVSPPGSDWYSSDHLRVLE